MTTLYSKTLDTDATAWEGRSLRQLLPAAGVASEGQIRVRFTAGSTGLQVDHASVALLGGATFPNVSATPTNLAFSGSAGFNIGNNATITSDWVTFAATSSDQIVVIMDITAGGTKGSFRYASEVGATVRYKDASASYNQATVVSYANAGAASVIALIETQVGVTTVSLTGISATASRGSLTGRVSKALTGQAGTASKGTPTVLFSRALTGQSLTGSPGTITRGPFAKALTGMAATASRGSLTARLLAAISGLAGTMGIGSVGYRYWNTQQPSSETWTPATDDTQTWTPATPDTQVWTEE